MTPVLLAFGRFIVNDDPCGLCTVYFGKPNLDPVTNPKPPYADLAMTTHLPAKVDLTIAGSPPHHVYLDGSYSIRIEDWSGEVLADWSSVNEDSEELASLTTSGILGGVHPVIGATGPLIDGVVRLGAPFVDPRTGAAHQLGATGVVLEPVTASGPFSIGVYGSMGETNNTLSTAVQVPPSKDTYVAISWSGSGTYAHSWFYKEDDFATSIEAPWPAEVPGDRTPISQSYDGNYISTGLRQNFSGNNYFFPLMSSDIEMVAPESQFDVPNQANTFTPSGRFLVIDDNCTIRVYKTDGTVSFETEIALGATDSPYTSIYPEQCASFEDSNGTELVVIMGYADSSGQASTGLFIFEKTADAPYTLAYRSVFTLSSTTIPGRMVVNRERGLLAVSLSSWDTGVGEIYMFNRDMGLVGVPTEAAFAGMYGNAPFFDFGSTGDLLIVADNWNIKVVDWATDSVVSSRESDGQVRAVGLCGGDTSFTVVQEDPQDEFWRYHAIRYTLGGVRTDAVLAPDFAISAINITRVGL